MQLGFQARDGLGRIGSKLHLHVAGVFRSIIARKVNRSGSSARHNHGFGDELRRGAIGIEIAQHSIHPGFRKREIVVAERSVGLEDRMIVHKEFQILADHEHVK